MDVKFYRIEAEVAHAVSAPRPERAGSARKTTGGEEVSFPATSEWEAAVRELPEARPAEVARARELVARDDYPPDATLVALARLLAMRLEDSDEASP